MPAYRFSREEATDVSPLTPEHILEGLNVPPPQGLSQPRRIRPVNSPLIGFDIETYSPLGFPDEGQDPVVTATLAISPNHDVRCGLVLISLIYPPHMEEEMLMMLRHLLASIGQGCLVTYNGKRFDLQYVAHRGEIYGLDFEGVLSNLGHIDIYELLRRSWFRPPGYGQKTVERHIGINRIVNDVSGSTYHEAFQSFLRYGDLKPLFYNIEDTVGCLLILRKLSRAGGINLSSFK